MQFYRFDWLSRHGIWAIIPCSPYMVSVRVSLKLEASWVFFSRRIERCPKQIALTHFLEYWKCNFIERKKTTNKQKRHKSLFESLSKNTWKHMELKYLDQIRKKTSVASSWSRSHSPIESLAAAGLSDIKNINHNLPATNTGYAAIH